MSFSEHTSLSAHLLSYSCSVQPTSHARAFCPSVLGHCWTFIWPAVQHPGSWNTWKDFCKRTRKYLFVYTKMSTPRVSLYAAHSILKNPSFFSNHGSVPHFRKNFIVILIEYFLWNQILKRQYMNSSTLILLGNNIHVNETIWKQTNLCGSLLSCAIT